MTQVQCENSHFRTLMAAQLSAAGSEEHVQVAPVADAVCAVSHGDEHREEVKLSMGAGFTTELGCWQSQCILDSGQFVTA
jgi:hypothetical protein